MPRVNPQEGPEWNADIVEAEEGGMWKRGEDVAELLDVMSNLPIGHYYCFSAW
jgi:hypothetical protein